MIDPKNHQSDSDIVEYFRSYEHLGGERTVNFVIGPMHVGQGRRGNGHFVPDEAKGNFYRSSTIRNNVQARYTTKCGVLKPLLEAFLAIADDNRVLYSQQYSLLLGEFTHAYS